MVTPAAEGDGRAGGEGRTSSDPEAPSPATAEQVVGGLDSVAPPFDPFEFLGLSGNSTKAEADRRFGPGTGMDTDGGTTMMYARHEAEGETFQLLQVLLRAEDGQDPEVIGISLQFHPSFDYVGAGIQGPLVSRMLGTTASDVLEMLGEPDYIREPHGVFNNADPRHTGFRTRRAGLFWIYRQGERTAHLGVYFRGSFVEELDLRWDPTITIPAVGEGDAWTNQDVLPPPEWGNGIDAADAEPASTSRATPAPRANVVARHPDAKLQGPVAVWGVRTG